MMPPDIAMLVRALSVVALPTIFAITFHEAAHGFVAHRLGDDTAFRQGRVTFNPLRHIDPFGTVILPLLLFIGAGFIFGYAKPVPVRFDKLRHPRADMIWVALAGPATNILLAFASAALLYVVPFAPAVVGGWLSKTLQYSVWINVLLAVFNMIPLPPLDGGRVAVGLLPEFLAVHLVRLERYGMLLLLLVVFILPRLSGITGHSFDFIELLEGGPVAWIIRQIGHVTGVPA